MCGLPETSAMPRGDTAGPCPACGSGDTRRAIEGRDRLLDRPERFAVEICRRCALAFTVPRLEGDAVSRYYDESYSPHGGGTSPLRDVVGRARIAAGPFRVLRTMRPGRALDVGAGHGGLGRWLADRGWEVDCVEPSPAAAARARARGLVVHEAPFDAVELDTRFDAILFNHSLEHLADPSGGLRKAHSLLRAGGRVLIAVPDFGSWQRRLFGSRWFHLDLPRHIVHFDSATLARALAEAGFRDARARPSVSAVGFWASIQYVLAGRCVLRGRARSSGLLLADVLYPLLLPTRLLGGDVLVATARR